MKKYISLLLLITFLLALAGCTQTPAASVPTPDPIDDNYRSFYQIFVGSFSDSNDDGFGDLRGIINRMDYLNDGDINSGKSLGIQGIWLSPIFASPTYHKYDAKDYYSPDWRFGSLEDLQELIDLCHSRNVKLILDLVINHTSTQHEWFVQFKQARVEGDTQNPYYDYYTCVTTAEKQNGISYHKIASTDFWYEGNFSGDMPELNFDNDAVRQEVVDIAKFYLGMGIDGFRFDAVKYIYYGDTARCVDFWSWYMQQLKAINPEIYCVGECWSGEGEILEYYPAMNCFNFAVAQAEGVMAEAAKGHSIAKYIGYIPAFQQKVWDKNPDGMPMSFLSNHDMDRIAGAFITENNMRMAANLYLLSPGSPVIYYGEELGMRGSRGGEMTDANRRLAMLWGDEDTVKDPIGATYGADKQIQTTAAQQMADTNSLYTYYCRLLSIRHKYPAIARGVYTGITTPEKNLGGFVIAHEDQKLLLMHNNSAEELTVDLAQCKALEGTSFTELADFIGCGNAKLEGTTLTLGGYTSAVLQ